MFSKNNNKGFSLIELLIAVAIVGILSAIAVPSYGNYIARGVLTTAQSDLALLSLKYENRYQRMLSYPTIAKTDTAGLKEIVPGWMPASEQSDFEFSSSNATGATYTLVATGKSSRVNGCVITIDHHGEKSITNCAQHSSDGKWL